MHLYTILWEIYRVVRGKRLEIHSTKVYNMLRAVMILHTIVRKSMIKFKKKGRGTEWTVAIVMGEVAA